MLDFRFSEKSNFHLGSYSRPELVKESGDIHCESWRKESQSRRVEVNMHRHFVAGKLVEFSSGFETREIINN